jgi:putative protease
MEAGVRAFKIEGRLKSAPYVALATRVYREAIDAAAAGEAWALAENGKMGTGTPAKRRMSEEKMGTGTPARRRMSEEKMGTGTPARRRMSQSPFSELDMQQIFSRGFTHGYLDGVNHKALVDGGSPKNRGIQVGKVVSTKPGIVTVEELPPTVSLHLRAGDGIVFASGSASPEQELPGGRVYEVRTPKPGHIEISMGRDFDVASVAIGSEVWRTDDPALRKRLEATYAKDTIRRTTPLTATVSAAIGEPLLLSLRDDQGHEVSVASDEQLPKAEKHPVTIELLRQQLGRLGGTPFHLADVTTTKLDPVMARVSVLNDLRRKAVEELVRMREADARHAVVEPDALERMRGEFDGRMGTVPNDRGEGDSPHFRGFYVLVRTLPQLDSVIDWGATSALKPALVYCDFRDTSLHAEAVQRCRNAGMPVGLATLRVMMPGEDGFLEEIAGLKPDAVLVRNASAIEFFRNRAPEAPLVGDFSLNVANEIAADLMAKRGLTRITPGYDLSWRQLNDMLDRISPALFEVVLHAHAPMFHTRYCLLTAGGACRHACREARAELRDRLGVHHPIESDAGCRITIFNSVAQSACEYVEEMQERGVRAFRVELLRETARQTRDILSCYESLLSGPERGGAVWERLRHVTEDHVTRGTWKTE